MPKPGNASICVEDDGRAWIRGHRCRECGTVSERATLACRRCLARGTMEAFEASRNGKLVTWSIVHRSYPGVAVPFVSAVVELDDGLTLKGNLAGVADEDLRAGMPVSLEFDDANGATDREGNTYVAYHFAAAEKELSA